MMLSREVLQSMEDVRYNQGNKCQWYGCGSTDGIVVHHIFPRREYPELAAIERYMICYCDKHHTLWHWHYEKKISCQVTYWANRRYEPELKRLRTLITDYLQVRMEQDKE